MRAHPLVLAASLAACQAPIQEPGNRAPRIASLSLTPPEPGTEDAIVAHAVARDPDGDPVTLRYRWLVDERSVSLGASNTLEAAHTARGQRVRVEVTPSDGSLLGATRSAELEVLDSPPRVSLPVILPAAPTTLDPLEVIVTAEDPDGDPIELRLDWTVDGLPVEADGTSLDPALFVRGQWVQVEAIPNAGGLTGDAARSQPVEILNSPPGAPRVTIEPSWPVVGQDGLSCALLEPAVDPDEDTLSYRVEWTVDGAAHEGERVEAADLAWGQHWGCSLGADDGIEPGPAASAELQLPEAPDPAAVHVGPLAGAVTTDSAAFTLRTEAATTVRVELCESPDFDGELHRTEAAWAVEERDLTVQLRVAGLAADTLYHYRVLTAEQEQALRARPSLRTAPPEGSHAEFGFALFADLATEPEARGWAYSSAAALGPAFAIQLGDLDHRDPADSEPQVLESWRAMHRDVLADYRSGGVLAESLLPIAPFFHTWDDHDYGADNAHGDMPWAPLARQAFYEYFPVPEEMPNPEAGIWYRFRWAQLEVFLLDVRSQRCDNDEPDVASKSMLDCWGIDQGQRAWLEQGLLDSTATWKLLVSGSVWNPDAKDGDSWAQFQTEADELLDFIEAHGITGVFIASGDMHSGGGIDDGTHSGVPELNVPTTNTNLDNCTGGECGAWSEGIQVGQDPAGFGWVQLSHSDGVDTLELRTYSEFGEPRLIWRTSLP